ncbi:hypothetical protein [Methyloradius palustris]|uniref:Uncharacterized protein n=1 Tax=Methyloradius palustris TaxID=2778876 RepID=A0A8D5G506_9PROT|nr:hypothetical protein [Methyloradius palustris]BCM25845.1 hypothetical protein ZMTM_21040 [Methyloradius palustris]
MSDSDKTAVAAHLYVTMRRVANRVIDVEWMSKNEEYAKAILSLARQQGAEDLTHYADLYEGLMFGGGGTAATAVAAAPVAVTPKPMAPEPPPKPRYEEPTDDDDGGGSPPPSRYVGSLR